jgi:hypothetical protein
MMSELHVEVILEHSSKSSGRRPKYVPSIGQALFTASFPVSEINVFFFLKKNQWKKKLENLLESVSHCLLSK